MPTLLKSGNNVVATKTTIAMSNDNKSNLTEITRLLKKNLAICKRMTQIHFIKNKTIKFTTEIAWIQIFTILLKIV